MIRRKLPIGIQTFAKLREGDCYYVDKTGFALRLIEQASHSAGERAVMLIDEYDKPILDTLTPPDAARQIRDGLRNLYSVIKDADAHIRFAFLTGVSKFGKVSLFSGWSNLNDITADPEYPAIRGYTETDLDTVFAAEQEGLDRNQIRDWYNGYNWTGEAVCNPFDLLLLFEKRLFRPWWFETATPTFLVDLILERQVSIPQLGQLVASEALLSTFDVDHIATGALLFQTGYLTIDSVRQFGALVEYQLRYPNLEVRASLTGALLEQIAPKPADPGIRPSRLYQLLLANDFAGIEALFAALFAGIQTEWYRKNPIAQYEGYYAGVFFAYFAASGLDITPEDSSNAGRLDMAVRFNGQVYLFAFKVVELAPDGGALAQINHRGYADNCRAERLPIHLIGVEFSRERRSPAAFDVETLQH